MNSQQSGKKWRGRRGSIWDLLQRLNLILQLGAGLMVLAPLLSNVPTWLSEGFTVTVPAWSLIVAAIGAILLVWLIKKRPITRQTLNTSKPNNSLGRIYFDYPSGNPLMHDWVMWANPQGSREPEFKSVMDGRFGRVLQINPRDPYYIDHDVSGSESSANQVNVTLKPGAEWFVCFGVRVVSSEGSIGQDVWLSAKFSNKDPLYYKDSKDEWKIELLKTTLGKDWALLSINLPESVEATFGKDGWGYEKLTRIRLRGDLTIARIEFFGS